MIRDFEDYLEKANEAETIEELFEILIQTVRNHGLDRAIFSLATDHRHLDLPASLGLIHNYPDDWLKHYNEQGFDKIDPVLSFGITQASAFEWREIPTRVPLTKRQMDCLNLGTEAGLHNGIATPLRGPNNQLAGLAFASSETKDSFDGKLDLINSYCQHFYVVFQRLYENRNLADKNLFLTDKEREVLTWMASGKSYIETAQILNMSTHTVDFHMRNIFKKLDVNDQTLAVVKAYTLGLIHP